MQMAHERRDGVHTWVRLERAREVAPVQVGAARVSSVVAPVHTVRVDHRDELKDEPLAQRARSRIVLAQQEVDEAVEDMRCGRLSRMDTRGEHEHRLRSKRASAAPALGHQPGLT